MSVLSRQGVPAQGTSTVSVNGVVPVPLQGVTAGNPRWLTDDLLIFQAERPAMRAIIDELRAVANSDNNALTPTGEASLAAAEAELWGLFTWSLAEPSEPLVEVSAQGQNELFAGAHMWAANLNTGYRDARGLHEPAWAVLGGNGGYGVDNETGLVAVCPDRATGHGLSVWDGFALTAIETVQVQPEMCYRGGFLLYRLLSGEFKSWHHDEGHADPPSQVPVAGCWHSGIWRLGYQDGRGLVVFGWDKTEGLLIHGPGEPLDRDNYPDIQTLEDGTIKVVSSRTTGQDPQDLQTYLVNPAASTVNGQPRQWVDLLTPPVPPQDPIPVPAVIRNGWFGLTDENPPACGNTMVGWYADDPRPCVESAPFIPDDPGDKLLGIVWSPLEAPDERGQAIWKALAFSKPILVYCDAPEYLDSVYAELESLRATEGVDAFPFVQAYPADGETAVQSFDRIDAQVMALRMAGEDRIALWRYARYGAFLSEQVDALLPLLTELREHEPAIIYDVGFRKTHNVDERIFDYYRGCQAVMVDGDIPPAPLYRPPVPPDPDPGGPVVSPKDYADIWIPAATDLVMQTTQPYPLFPANMSRADIENAVGSSGNRPRSKGIDATIYEMVNGGVMATFYERQDADWPTPMIDGSVAKAQDQIYSDCLALTRKLMAGGSAPRPSREDVLNIRASYCNFFDTGGNPVYGPSLSWAEANGRFDEWMQIYRDAGNTHVVFGPFGPGPAYPGAGDQWVNPSLMDPQALRAFIEKILNTPSASGKGFVPILFLDGGGPDPKPRIDHDWPTFAEALKDLHPFVIIVPGWEPVRGDWTSAELSYGMQKTQEFFPDAIKACHLSPNRGAGSSNPVEPDDPWQGDESGFWKSHGGEFMNGQLYQTEHGDDLYEPTTCQCALWMQKFGHQDSNELCAGNRMEDAVARSGAGFHGWRVLDFVCAFETAAYEIYRKQKTNADALHIAQLFDQRVYAKWGVKFTWGNGG